MKRKIHRHFVLIANDLRIKIQVYDFRGVSDRLRGDAEPLMFYVGALPADAKPHRRYTPKLTTPDPKRIIRFLEIRGIFRRDLFPRWFDLYVLEAEGTI